MGMSLDGMGLNSDISLTTFLVSEMHYTYMYMYFLHVPLRVPPFYFLLHSLSLYLRPAPCPGH